MEWWQITNEICCWMYIAYQSPLFQLPTQQSLWGQHGAHLGPVGPRWAPCWSHEPCYQDMFIYNNFIWSLCTTVCFIHCLLYSPTGNHPFLMCAQYATLPSTTNSSRVISTQDSFSIFITSTLKLDHLYPYLIVYRFCHLLAQVGPSDCSRGPSNGL